MKKNQFFALSLSLILGVSSLFAADPVKPTGPGKPDKKAPEQSYVWIKYSCATSASDPRNVELVVGYGTGGLRPCYRPQNFQPGTTLQTGKVNCPQINPFQECTAAWGNICAVRYTTTEIEPIDPGVNIRPKVGVTFAGHDIAYCGSMSGDPCIPLFNPACTNSWPYN